MAPGLRCGAICLARSLKLPTGVHRITRSASLTARKPRMERNRQPAQARRRDRAHRLAGVVAGDVAGQPAALDGMRRWTSRSGPTPISAISFEHQRAHEFAQRRDDALVGFLGAHSQAQGVRQAISGDGAQDQAPRRRNASALADSSRLSGNWIRTKLPTLSFTARPSLRISSGQPILPMLVMGDRTARHGRGRAIAAAAAHCCVTETLNGPRMRFSTSQTRGRRKGPADPQAGKAVHLREGARHHHIVELRHHLDAGFVIVACGHIRL